MSVCCRLIELYCFLYLQAFNLKCNYTCCVISCQIKARRSHQRIYKDTPRAFAHYTTRCNRNILRPGIFFSCIVWFHTEASQIILTCQITFRIYQVTCRWTAYLASPLWSNRINKKSVWISAHQCLVLVLCLPCCIFSSSSEKHYPLSHCDSPCTLPFLIISKKEKKSTTTPGCV